MNTFTHVTILLSLSLAAFGSSAQDAPATQAEAAQRMKGILELAKAKGVPTAGAQIMSADDPFKCRYKEMACMILAVADGTFVANTAVPKLVGQKFPPDLADVDGVPIIDQQLGPAREGKTKWEAKFKFAQPGTKKVVPRWAFCEKADAAHVACVVINQP